MEAEVICQMFHTVSRMRENCTYGSMRGRTYPAGASRSTLPPMEIKTTIEPNLAVLKITHEVTRVKKMV